MNEQTRVREEVYIFAPTINNFTIDIMSRIKVIPFYPTVVKMVDGGGVSDWLCVDEPEDIGTSKYYVSKVNSEVKRIINKGYDTPILVVLTIIEIGHIKFDGISVCSGSESRIDMHRGETLARGRALNKIVKKLGWQKAAELGLVDPKHNIKDALSLSKMSKKDKRSFRFDLKERGNNEKEPKRKG